MSSVTIGFLVGGLTLVLLALRIHIGMAMLVAARSATSRCPAGIR